MLMTIDETVLTFVHGGQNSTTTTDGRGSKTEQRTDYAYCVDSVKRSCDAANPGFLWGTDERKSAQCRLEETPRICGQPPLPSKP